MGTAMTKFSSGNEEKKGKEIGPILDDCYDKLFQNSSHKKWELADFYRAVCETVEQVNVKLGYTQIRVPEARKLRLAFDNHHRAEGKLTKDEFQQIFREVVLGTGFTGIGIKDSLYIFGVPLTALMVKQGVLPRAIPNEIFIPAITSVTVLILATLNKL
ncbi:hypothetical protein I3843_09G048100 [Carya illinoinensis]|nr:hypothetical protein I3843_09G048100 [Carya illinoinensis]